MRRGVLLSGGGMKSARQSPSTSDICSVALFTISTLARSLQAIVGKCGWQMRS